MSALAQRHRRRQAWHLARINGAITPGDRVSAATDYLRAALANLPDDEADEIAHETVMHMVGIAERIIGSGSS